MCFDDFIPAVLEIVLLWVMEPTVDSAVALLDLLLDAMTFTGHEGRRWKGLQDITRLPGLEMLDAKAAENVDEETRRNENEATEQEAHLAQAQGDDGFVVLASMGEDDKARIVAEMTEEQREAYLLWVEQGAGGAHPGSKGWRFPGVHSTP